MSMWAGLSGQVKRRAGVSGTETFASGAFILQIKASAASSGTIQMPSGDGSTTITVTVPSGAPFSLQENHTNFVLQGAGTQLQLVFTSTNAYFIEYIEPVGAS